MAENSVRLPHFPNCHFSEVANQFKTTSFGFHGACVEINMDVEELSPRKAV